MEDVLFNHTYFQFSLFVTGKLFQNISVTKPDLADFDKTSRCNKLLTYDFWPFGQCLNLYLRIIHMQSFFLNLKNPH